MTEREGFLWVVEQYHGTFYTWGGDDPDGFDCSGLAIEGLKAVGRVPRRRGGAEWDTTAQGLLDLGKARGWELKATDLRPGCLVFYLNDVGKAIHVEVVWRDPKLSIGASGGGSRTRTKEDAIAQNAYVKIRPWKSRGGPYAFLDPFRELEVPVG